MSAVDLWRRFQKYLCICPTIDLTLDVSRMTFDDAFLQTMEPAMQKAFQGMDALEKGAIANPDEKRMVGHYWLRAPDKAPTAEIRKEISETCSAIKGFAMAVHAGKVKPQKTDRFTHVLSIGIGGSALGPEFVSDALGDPATDKMSVSFIDNTDPDGIARTFRRLKGQLPRTLCLVISKSGGTPEPHNGMLNVAAAYSALGLDFAKHAVAITGSGSHLDKQAQAEGWLTRFPMWDWVGGRTSETGPVGLVPAALQGVDIDALLAGAAACDAVTRVSDTLKNPAALLALMWFHATGGKGQKDMVVLPYKDRLLLFSRYLQQLVMESLGKRLDLTGQRVDQGIAVYGNKGSTDQHAYVQQLRDGVNNFFATFIRVLEAGGHPIEVQKGVTAGDYLHGFLLGTRHALFDNDRQSVTISVRRPDARTIGVLIALFERAVGFYGSLVNINAYHQPGVEAGKKAAASVLEVQSKVTAALGQSPQSAEQIAAKIGAGDSVETVYHLLEHLSANGRAKVAAGVAPSERTFTGTAAPTTRPHPSPMDLAEPGVLRVFTSKDESRHYYNKIAKIYDLMADASEAPARQSGLGMLAVKPGEKVLEVGFGTGHCLVDLAKAVGPTGKVFGVDISDAMVDLARETLTKAGLADRAELTRANGQQLPYADGSLDAIFMSFTLELFDTPELQPFLKECQRVLRPGGRIGVVGMSKESGQGVVFHLYEWTHKHFPNLVDCRPIFIARALEEAGFRIQAKENRVIWVPVEIVVAVKSA